MLQDRKSVCLIPILAYEVFATKCFYHCVILSKYYRHCHFQLNSRHVLFVPRIFHISSKFNKGNFKCKKKKVILKTLISFIFLKTLKLK